MLILSANRVFDQLRGGKSPNLLRVTSKSVFGCLDTIVNLTTTGERDRWYMQDSGDLIISRSATAIPSLGLCTGAVRSAILTWDYRLVLFVIAPLAEVHGELGDPGLGCVACMILVRAISGGVLTPCCFQKGYGCDLLIFKSKRKSSCWS